MSTLLKLLFSLPGFLQSVITHHRLQEGDDLLFEVVDYDKGSLQGDLMCSCVVPNKDHHQPCREYSAQQIQIEFKWS